MKKINGALTATLLATVMLGGCSLNENQQNTLGGAGIGAVAGGVIGSMAGGGRGALTGAAIGAAAGAVGGSLMTPSHSGAPSN